MKAIVSVTFDNEIVIHDIKIVEIKGKTILTMPSKEIKNNVFKDIVHPINKKTRKYLENIVLKAYFDIINIE